MRIWETKSGYKIFQILSGRSNVFLLTNGKRNILIDTGTKFMWNTLEKELKQLNVNSIDYLILTHTHFDHAGNSSRIKEKYDAKIIVHKDEASYLKSGENIIPEGTNWFTGIIVKLFAKKFLSKVRYESCDYDLPVDSLYAMNDIGFDAYIMHTPGHTVGSVSVIIDNEAALVGDTMFGVSKWSVFPPYANDIKQMVKSWGSLLETKCSVFIPTHGSANDRSLVQKDYNKRR
jgi:glyoxylase-like metal-dependent hydrolase (beta-lactamase superfamily II)